MLHVLIEQAQWEVSNQSAPKCHQYTSILPSVPGDIALLTHCIILDVDRA